MLCSISRVWIQVPVLALVSLSKIPNHHCCVLQVGCKAMGAVELSYT